MEFLSFDELDLFDDESDNDGYGSVSPGTYTFLFCSYNSVGSVGESVGHVRCVGSFVFILTGV